MSDLHSTTPVQYREISGHPLYRVGSDGSVWSKKKNVGCGWSEGAWKRLTPVMKNGYHKYRLYDGTGKWVDVWAHRVVLEAFVGPAPEGTEGCHAPDPTRSNNALGNLRWDTRSANGFDAFKYRADNGIPDPESHVVGEDNPFAKLTEADILDIRAASARGVRNTDQAKKYGVCDTHISRIVHRVIWKHVA